MMGYDKQVKLHCEEYLMTWGKYIITALKIIEWIEWGWESKAPVIFNIALFL